MPASQPAAETMHKSLEQSCVLGFFRDEQLERLPIGEVVLCLARGFGKEMTPAAAFPELKMREGARKAVAHRVRQGDRRVPVRFNEVAAIGFEVVQPA